MGIGRLLWLALDDATQWLGTIMGNVALRGLGWAVVTHAGSPFGGRKSKEEEEEEEEQPTTSQPEQNLT